jgi:hypothetical protein
LPTVTDCKQQPQGGGAAPPLPTPHSPLPITKPILAALGLPWFEIEPEKLENVIHGKVLSPVLEGKELVRQGLYMPPGESLAEAAGVFCGGELAAIVEKKGGDWKYGYVYANS